MKYQPFTYYHYLRPGQKQGMAHIYSDGLNDLIHRMMTKHIADGMSISEASRHLAERVFHDLSSESIRRRYHEHDAELRNQHDVVEGGETTTYE
jgi:hypothetical protein